MSGADPVLQDPAKRTLRTAHASGQYTICIFIRRNELIVDDILLLKCTLCGLVEQYKFAHLHVELRTNLD